MRSIASSTAESMPEAEQVDLQEAGIAAAVLVPLADLATCHRGGLHGHEVDERPSRDDHAAGVLADVPRQSGDLVRQLAKRIPAGTACVPGHAVDLVCDACRVPAVGDACKPFELGERQSDRLADIADRTAAAIRGEARHKRRVLTAIPLGDANDQLLADVPWEVEIDVRHGGHLVVDEAPEREAGLDRVDVRQAREVADDRPDTRAAAAAGRQRMPRAAGPAHLERTLARQFEHLPVQQEEPGKPEPGDQLQLVVEPFARLAFVTVRLRVPLHECAIADLAQLHIGRIDAVREVGIAVAELLGQVEAAAVCDLARLLSRSARQPLEQLRRCQEDALVIATPLALAAVERRALLDRHERVLELRAPSVVCVHVAGRDRGHAKRLGQVCEHGVAACVTAFVRPLQLDVERAWKRTGEPCGCVRVDDAEPVTGTARQCHETLGMFGDDLDARLRRQQLALAARQAGARVRVGEDATEVRVALLRLAEQRHVRTAFSAPAPAKPAPPLLRGSVKPTPPSVTSAPVIGRTPRCFAACANSSEP